MDGSLPVFDEHGFFAYSSRTGDKCGQDQQRSLGANEVEFIPYEKQHNSVPVSVSELGISTPEVAHLENSSIFFSMPNQPTDQSELSLYENQPVNAPASVSESGTDLSTGVPLENLNGLLSMPTMLNQHMDMLLESKNRLDNLTERTLPEVGTYQLIDKKQGNVGINNPFVSSTIGEGIDNVVPEVQSYNRSGFSGISWGSYEEVMEALSSPQSSYSLLYEQHSFQTPHMHRKKSVGKPNNNAKLIPTQVVKSSLKSTNINLVKESAGKEPPQSFPSNVKSLIGTGVFNEVLVRYVSPLGGHQLPGIISEAGYLCGCQLCNFSKTLNAYEFEQHAGCKTSHPNNHILFENGKSMHQIVQELKATPRSLLFHVIQTVAGSSINQEAFRAWKESFRGDH